MIESLEWDQILNQLLRFKDVNENTVVMNKQVRNLSRETEAKSTRMKFLELKTQHLN